MHLKNKNKMLAYHHIEFRTKNHHYENLSQEEYDTFINLSNNINIRKLTKGTQVL